MNIYLIQDMNLVNLKYVPDEIVQNQEKAPSPKRKGGRKRVSYRLILKAEQMLISTAIYRGGAQATK